MIMDWVVQHQASFAKTSRVVIAAGVIAAITLVATSLACRAANTSSGATQAPNTGETAAP